jgi:hypothetical protein
MKAITGEPPPAWLYRIITASRDAQSRVSSQKAGIAVAVGMPLDVLVPQDLRREVPASARGECGPIRC